MTATRDGSPQDAAGRRQARKKPALFSERGLPSEGRVSGPCDGLRLDDPQHLSWRRSRASSDIGLGVGLLAVDTLEDPDTMLRAELASEVAHLPWSIRSRGCDSHVDAISASELSYENIFSNSSSL